MNSRRRNHSLRLGLVMTLSVALLLPAAASAVTYYNAPRDHTRATSWTPRGDSSARFTKVGVTWDDEARERIVKYTFYVDAKKTVLLTQSAPGASLKRVGRNSFFRSLRKNSGAIMLKKWYWARDSSGRRIKVLTSAATGAWE